MLSEEELIILDSHIICPRLDVFPSIQEKLERGMVIGFDCERSQENALLFKELYESHTKASMTIRTSQYGKRRVIYKAGLRCHRNVPLDAKKPRTKSRRDTGCPWAIVLLVKTPPIGRCKLSPVAHCGLVVSGHGAHNHSLNMPVSLAHHRVPAEAHRSYPRVVQSHHVDLVHNFVETQRKSILHDMQTHPDRIPAWEKAMTAFMTAWNGASPSAQIVQLNRAVLPRSATSTHVKSPQRRTACPPRGRRRTSAGHPAKAVLDDHQYIKKAEHDLNLCEAENIAPGDIELLPGSPGSQLVCDLDSNPEEVTSLSGEITIPY